MGAVHGCCSLFATCWVGKTGIKVYSVKIHFFEGVEDLLGVGGGGLV